MIDPRITGANVPYVEFTQVEGGSSDENDILIELKKVDGEAEDEVFVCDIYLSDSSIGNGITSETTSAAAAVDSGYGVLLDVVLTKKHWLCSTNAAGQINLVVKDSNEVGFYVCVMDPRTGRVNVSDALVNYTA